MAVVTWGVESKVRSALCDITVPMGCPESLLFVPESFRTSVLQWGHSSSLACHPGAIRTHRLIKQRFWWPSMVRDALRFVSACPICGTATIVLDHVFRIHGLPVDVVSDRGPQFVSKFWTEFCQKLGARASLSSGYHLQTNGQAEWANQDLETVLYAV